jgi:protein-S-isoprenylcysteine O-methyltransferase Ste14
MPQKLAALTTLLLLGTVVSRVLLLRRTGTHAMHFGKIDKTDFLIPPLVLSYFYALFAAAFGWPLAIDDHRFFQSAAVAWVGVGLCLGGVSILAFSLVSFGTSFRVGIDTEQPGHLVTTGIFAVSRNPIYVGFFLFLLGQFLAFPGWTTLFALVFAALLFHRQVLREEEFMRQRYGQEYIAYCDRVRRYV